MIEENVGKMYMAPEWEYSGGGAEEYLHAVQMIFGFKQRWNIEIFDAHGKPLFFHDGLSILTRALADLKQRKRKAKTLEEVIHGLRNLWQVQFCPEISHELPKVWNQNFLDKADKHVVDDVIKYIDKNFELNYDKTIFLDSGLPPRRNLPENIILKAEDPPA